VTLNETTTVGVHVPVSMPKNPSLRPRQYRDFDLFTEPGETRDIFVSIPLDVREAGTN
jgi:hypothetical protein